MIEVTDEMLQVLKDYCDFYISGADAIERIIELHEQSKWVSVDTPPTKDGAYLTNLGEAFFVATGHDTNQWRPRFTRHEHGTSSIKGITHWQPLPEFKEGSE